jgi:hypothetical protein
MTFGSLSESNALSVAVTGGGGNLNMSGNTATLDFTGFTRTSNFPTLIYGSLILSSTMTITTPNTSFAATSGNWIVQSSGKVLGTLAFGPTSGNSTATWDLQDSLSNGSNVVNYYTGTLNTNNYSLSIGGFHSSSSQTRVLNFGSSAVAVGVNGFFFSSGTGLTFNAGTSVISLTGTSGNLNIFTAGMAFYDVAFTSTAAVPRSVTGTNTFNNFSITNRGTSGVSQVSFNHNQTINGTLTLSAGPNILCRTFLASNTIGAQRTLTVATFAAGSSGYNFRDIVVTGTAAPIAPASAGDCGNNSGITFPAAKTVYWNLTGTQNWTANGWAATSGGTPAVDNFPLAQDTAVFDNTGAATTVQINSPISVGTLDMSTRAIGMTLQISSATLSIYSNLALGTGVTLSFTSAVIDLVGPNNHTLTSAGKTFGSATNINLVGGGTTTLQDTFNASGSSLSIISGTFDMNSQTTTIGNFNVNSTTNTAAIANGTVTCGGGTISTGTLAVGTGYNINCTSTYTFNNGTITINDGVSLPIAFFNSTGSGTRVINFGTGQFTVSGNSGTIWNLAGTNLSFTGTFKVVTTDSSNNAKTIVHPSVNGLQQDISTSGSSGYIISAASNYRIVPQGWYNTINLSGMAVGSVFDTGNGLSVYGDFSLGGIATTTTGGFPLTFAATSGVKTINTGGSTLSFAVTFNGTGGTWQLQAAVTVGSGQLTTLTAGTLDLNGYTFATPRFDTNSGSARSIAFGTGNITITGPGVVWVASTQTNFSRTGTPTVNISNNSANATTVQTGSPTEAQALDFNYTTGTYTLTDTSARYRSLNLTGFAGTFPATTRTFYGGFNAGSTATMPSNGFENTFAATSGVWDITSNGRSVDMLTTFNGVGGTWRLQDAFTTASDKRITLTAGTLNLNGFTLTCGQFNTDGSAARAIEFGSGSITVTTTSSSSMWSSTPLTNFSRTGTPTVNISRNSSTAATVTTGAATEAQALDFNYTVGTYVLTDTSAVYRGVNLTGFAGTYANNARTYFGGFNAGSTATMDTGANVQTFAATSGTWSITRNGRTLNFPFTFNGIGGTWQLQDNFTVGSSRAFTLTNGTLDINGQTTSVGIFTLFASTSRAIANGTLTCASVTHTAGDFSVGGTYNINSTGTYTFTAGTLTINDGVALPVGAFSSNNSNARTIAFGTGQISLTGNNTTIWNNQTATNFNFTGTFRVVATYTGGVGTRTITHGFSSEATAPAVSTTGSSGFILDTSSTDTKSLTGSWSDFDMTGVTGTLAHTTRTIYGNFNAGSTVTLTGGTSVTTFAATSGVKTITSNGRTLDFPLTFNGVGGTWQLADALTMGATRFLTLTSGTFDANNYNVTIGTMSSSTSNVRTLALGSGTWTVAGTGTAWDFTTPTNATITGTATISMNGATAKTFAGGGRTWPTLNQGGAGALTISGNNTFTNITSTQASTSACTITLTASSTQTLTNLTASGQSGRLLTLNSTTNGTRANLVVNNDVNLSFTSLRDNSVSGGFKYNALNTSGNVNVSNNLGWVFSLGGGSFISFF